MKKHKLEKNIEKSIKEEDNFISLVFKRQQ